MAAVGADPGKEQIRFNAADQAAARSALFRRSDLSSGWQEGRVTPVLSPGPTCPSYHPMQSDLVLTGVAESDYHRGGVEFDNQIQVLKTARMVGLDWRRSVVASGAVPCLRQILTKTLGPGARLVSFRRSSFPRLSTYARAYRALVEARVHGHTVRLGARAAAVIVDSPFGLAFLGVGRSLARVLHRARGADGRDARQAAARAAGDPRGRLAAGGGRPLSFATCSA